MEQRVFKELAEIVGEDWAYRSPEAIEPYTRAGIQVERCIDAVLLPGSVAEVQAIVRIAAKHQAALYPISTGRNWGYGSANPVQDNNVIVDLSRMDSIREVNSELAYAVVEPGVTQQALYETLEAGSTGLMMDPTGSGPSCSVLGNALERGYGITPYGDHFSFVCGMEIVLASGEVLQTGFGHFDTSQVSRVFKWGVGPYLDGLFTQSNFGIVTAIGVWLMPKPDSFEACYFSCDQDEAIYSLIEPLRKLLQHKVIQSSVNLAHRNRALTMLMQYPWEAMQGKTPLDEGLARKLAQERKIGAWNGFCGLYGSKAQVKAAKKQVKHQLRGKVSRINFISSSLLGFMEKYPKPLSLVSGLNVQELVKVIKPSFGILTGKPSQVSLASPYWRSKKKPPENNINPVADGCGLYWFAPVVPMTRGHAREFIRIIQSTLPRYGFESCIMFSSVTDRCFDCNLPILFDKEDEEQTHKAGACYEDLFESCMQAGFIPYRVGIQSMQQVMSLEDPFWNTVNALKQTLDPDNILSPGRYCSL